MPSGSKEFNSTREKNRKEKDWILSTRKSKIKLERKRAESRNTGGLRREKLGETISLGGDFGYEFRVAFLGFLIEMNSGL